MGTYHFASNYDWVKLNNGFNKARQHSELQALLQILSNYHPDALAAEVVKEHDTQLNEQYHSYLNHNFELTDNEVHQVLFQLGRKENIEKIHAVDWMDSIGERYYGDVMEWAKIHQPDIYEKFVQMSNDVSLKPENTIIENLNHINSDEYIDRSHEIHLKVSQIGKGTDYIGIDWVRWWYQRNLILYKNLIDIINAGYNKILLLVGGAHTYLLKQFLQETGEANVITFNDL